MTLQTDNIGSLTAARDRRKRLRQVPTALAVYRLLFSTLGPVAPGPMALWAHRLWFATRRSPVPAREQRWAAAGRREALSHEDRDVAVHIWGKGPPVLLVHGWNGRGTQLGAFIAPLTAAGRSVVAFDAPGHGETAGDSTNIFEMTAALDAVARRWGPFEGVIAHSLGVPCTALALSRGLAAQRVVALSPPADMKGLVDKFATALRIPDPVVRHLSAMIEDRFGTDVWAELSTRTLADRMDTPALVIHDRDDLDVPWQEGEAVAAAWPGARLELTSGLGHRRVLRNRGVVKMATEFLVG